MIEAIIKEGYEHPVSGSYTFSIQAFSGIARHELVAALTETIGFEGFRDLRTSVESRDIAKVVVQDGDVCLPLASTAHEGAGTYHYIYIKKEDWESAV